MLIKAAVCDSGEGLLMFELSSQTNKQTNKQTNTPLPSVTLSISVSCTSWDKLYEVFRGNAAKASVFGVLGWRLYPGRSVCFLFTESGLRMNTGLLFQRTQNRQLADCEEIFSESDKLCSAALKRVHRTALSRNLNRKLELNQSTEHEWTFFWLIQHVLLSFSLNVFDFLFFSVFCHSNQNILGSVGRIKNIWKRPVRLWETVNFMDWTINWVMEMNDNENNC